MLYIYIVGSALVVSIFILALKLRKYKKLWDCENAFFAGLTHDLKNPANAQISIFNMLLAGQFGKLTPQQKEIIELTRNSSKYMTNLVGTILTNYKSSNGNIKLNKTLFNLEKLVISVCSENIYQAKNKNIEIIYTSTPQDYTISADMIQIKRVIENLISNAIIYSLPQKNIEIKMNKKDNIIDFSVKNESIPIPEKEIKSLFLPFKRGINSAMNNIGSGLGLHVSKNIIQMHQGKIYVNKNTPNSIIFGFKLPASKKNNSLVIRN